MPCWGSFYGQIPGFILQLGGGARVVMGSICLGLLSLPLPAALDSGGVGVDTFLRPWPRLATGAAFDWQPPPAPPRCLLCCLAGQPQQGRPLME